MACAAPAVVAQSLSIPLFFIERNKNESIICYDLEIVNNAINLKNPIHAYWKRATGAINELSAIQKAFAFGFSIKEAKNNKVTFTMKAYPKRVVTVEYDAVRQQAVAYVSINGAQARFEKLYIKATPPAYRSVEYIVLTGTDRQTTKPVSERIDNT
jgi:hypothetical protein